MKKRPLHYLILFLVLLFSACESENIEDKYYKSGSLPSYTDSTLNYKSSEIIWLPFDGNLNDSTGNNTPLVFVGNQKFVDGLSFDYDRGLYLDGESYLLINLGYFDTLSVVFWIKGVGELDRYNTPVLFDYGQNAIAAQLDAFTGATALSVIKNDESVNSADLSSVEYLNSYNKYSFVYVEAGGDYTKAYFKGYTNSGESKVFYEELNLPGLIEAESEMLYIGRSSQNKNQSASFFRGAIDELHIYNKTLTRTEIEALAAIPTR